MRTLICDLLWPYLILLVVFFTCVMLYMNRVNRPLKNEKIKKNAPEHGLSSMIHSINTNQLRCYVLHLDIDPEYAVEYQSCLNVPSDFVNIKQIVPAKHINKSTSVEQ